MEENKVYFSILNKVNIKQDTNFERLETHQAKQLLKKMLSSFGIKMPKINISPTGKPYFNDSNIHFSYSHSKNYIACAISFYEVGIDIEETSRYINDGIAKKYLDNVKGNKKRIETWVKKEAYSKLKKLGLQMKFQNIRLNEIASANFFINKEEYMCSIYCANYAKFKELSFNGSE